MYRALLSAWQHPDSLLVDGGAIEDPNRRILDGGQPAHLLDRMMLADQLTYLPDDILAKVDRASMAVSLEVRAPLLDHHLMEHVASMPSHLKLRGRTGKYIFKKAMEPVLPKEILHRRKQRFAVPLDHWFRHELRGLAYESLFS